MWNNIGRKLMKLAKVVCWLGIIGSALVAIVLWFGGNRYNNTFLLGLLYLVGGGFLSWIGSWSMYGLGLVVDHVENRSYTTSVSTNSDDNSSF